MIDNDDIAVAVQQRLRHAEHFDTFLESLQELIDQHRAAKGNHYPRPAQRKGKGKKRGGQKGSKRRPVTKVETKRIIKLRAAGIPFQKIADRMERAPSVIRNVWRRAQA